MGHLSAVAQARTSGSIAAGESGDGNLDTSNPTIAWAAPLGIAAAGVIGGLATARIGAASALKNTAAVALGLGGIVGASLLYNSLKTHTYQVTLSSSPDYSEVMKMPEGPERQVAAYKVMTDHWAEKSVCVEGALRQWESDGLVQDYSAHPINNSFVVAVPGWKQDDFVEKMRLVDGAGEIDSADDI